MAIVPVDPDLALRQAAIARARELWLAFDQIVPLTALREGFQFEGSRISFGSFQKGIHRAKEQRGPAALSLMTAAPKPGREAPYPDDFDPAAGAAVYHYRAGPIDQPDNRALRAAAELQTPVLYFWGLDPGQYLLMVPAFVISDDPVARTVRIQEGLPQRDTQGTGIVSAEETRRYATHLTRRRLHQEQFRRTVLRAYRERCAVCALRERELLQASHILRDSDPEGIAGVVNGLALCAIHHLAYDRNLMGIDPEGVVHIGSRLLHETDGPMLASGIQGFHGASILQPRRPEERPDPDRLDSRFKEFQAAA